MIFSSAASIREIKRLLQEENMTNTMVIAGGAAVKQVEKEDLNVDMIAKDAFELIRFLRVLEGNGAE